MALCLATATLWACSYGYFPYVSYCRAPAGEAREEVALEVFYGHINVTLYRYQNFPSRPTGLHGSIDQHYTPQPWRPSILFRWFRASRWQTSIGGVSVSWVGVPAWFLVAVFAVGPGLKLRAILRAPALARG